MKLFQYIENFIRDDLDMLNLTLLSFTITSSFQKSPFLHLPSTVKPSYTHFKTINANQLFSSFIITQSLNSFSIIEESTFNRFVTTLPVLSFKTKDAGTTIRDQYIYGDTIPGSNNQFYNTNYAEIINCKFMSITDNYDIQPISVVGLCIYTTKSARIDSCYFFAIMSLRTGSAILFDEKDEHIESVVVNCIFKSITQTIYDIYLTGGAVSYGYMSYNEDDFSMQMSYVYSSLTDNCCFDKIRLDRLINYGFQGGIVSYFADIVKSKNLNFTNTEMIGANEYGEFTQCGDILSYIIYPVENSFSFINIFNCDYNYCGSFTLFLQSSEKVEFLMTFTNLINNTGPDYSEFVVMVSYVYEAFLGMSNIQCNNQNHFLEFYFEAAEDMHIDVSVSNSLFKCSFDSFLFNDDPSVFNVTYDNNIFENSDFDVDITNNIISNFGYIKTSQFSPSDTFLDPLISNSLPYFDLNTDIPKNIIVIISFIGGISVIVFVIILCYRGKTSKFEIDEFNQLDLVNEMEDISINQNTNETKSMDDEKNSGLEFSSENK